MRHLIGAAALLLLAAACQRGSDDTQASDNRAPAMKQGEPKAARATATLLQPGEWESRVESIEMKFETVETPQGKLSLDDSKPSPPPPYRLCVTEEKSRQLFKQYRTGGAAGQICSQSNFTMKEGRIHGILVCTVQGEKSERQLDGHYTSASYDVTEVEKTRALTPPGAEIAPTRVPVTITKRMTARRIGDCPVE